MRSCSSIVWSTLIIWICIGSSDLFNRKGQDNPNCPTCIEAKPLTSKYKYSIRNRYDKTNHPVAILLAFNSNEKPKKTALNAIEISREIFGDTEYSEESVEIPVKSRGGKLSARTTHALERLLRPLIENGELESASEEQARNDWECKRDELINLLRVVLKKKDHVLTNKYGVIHHLDTPVVPVPSSAPVFAIAPITPIIQHSDSALLDDIAEILEPLPLVIREKVESNVKDLIEKVGEVKLPDLKTAIKNVIRNVVKNLIESAIKKEEATDDIHIEADDHFDVTEETSTEHDKKPKISGLKNLLVNISPKKIKEKLLKLMKRIIEIVAEKGVEALEELVTELLVDLIKDLATTVEDISTKLEKLKPVLKEIGKKITGGIKEILKISAGSELDSLKDKVKSILKKLIEQLLELLVPDKGIESSTPDSSTHSSVSPKGLITKALLSVVDKIFDELSDDKSKNENVSSDENEKESKPIFSTISEVFDRLKQIPEIIEQKLLEGVRRIIGQFGKDNGPTLEEMVNDIVEEIISGVLSPEKPLPEPVRKLLQPIVKKVSTIVLNAVKEIITKIASKNMEGLEDAVKSIVTDLLKDVIEFISGDDKESPGASPTSALPALISDVIPDEFRPILDKILEKLLTKESEPVVKTPIDHGNCDKDYDGIDDDIPKPKKPGLVDILKIGAKVLSGIKSVVEKIGVENLEILKDKLKEIVTSICDEDELKDIMKPILHKINGKILECLTNILGLAIKNDIQNVGDAVKDLIQNLLGELLKLLVPNDCEKANSLKELLDKFAPIISEIIEKFAKSLKDKAKDFAEDILDIGGKTEDLKSEDANESASHIDEVKSEIPSNQDYDPIPEGLVSDKLLPVIDEIVDVLDKGGMKDNKDFIKEITDELLKKLLTKPPEKDQHDKDEISGSEQSKSISEEHDDNSSDKSLDNDSSYAHLDQSHDETVSTVLPVVKAVVETPFVKKALDIPSKNIKEDIPEIIVTPTYIKDTFRVSLDIDKLVDKEYKKFMNLQCSCNQGSIDDEKCPFHTLSKDDLKNSIRGQFFSKLIKSVPLAKEPYEYSAKLDSYIEDDDSEEGKVGHYAQSHYNIIKKLLEKAGNALLTGKETIDDLLDKEDGKKKLLVVLKKILKKLIESKKQHIGADEMTEKIKKLIEGVKHLPDLLELLLEKGVKSKGNGDILKELLRRVTSGLADKVSISSEARRKREDFEKYPALMGDDNVSCPSCSKILAKRSDNHVGIEQLLNTESESNESSLLQQARAKREDGAYRVERAIGGGCLPCSGAIYSDFLNNNSTEIYEDYHRSERITRGNQYK